MKEETAPNPDRRWLLVGLWIVVTVAIVVGGAALPWRDAITTARRAHLGWMVAAVLSNLLILPLWAEEWRIVVPGPVRVTFPRMFGVVAITASVLNSIPFLAGELSAVALLIERGGLSRGAALSVLAMDQLLVAFAKLSVLGMAALIAPLPGWLRSGMLTLLAIVAVLLACLIPLAHRWQSVQAYFLRTPTRLRIAVAHLVSWGAHFETLRDPRRAMLTSLLAIAKKVAELGGVLSVQLAFGFDPSLGTALLVLGALALSTMIPVAPANLGIYEATVFAVYRYAGHSPEAALGLALIQHLCFLLPSLASGYLILSVQQLRLRRLPAS